MAGIFAFKCTCCGEIHEGSPSYAFNAPYHYSCLSDEDKSSKAGLSSDFCVIRHDDQTDYFVRAVLAVPIHGVADPFVWGVWTSLSEKSFRRYYDTYDAPVAGDVFFGRVCNRIPWYPQPQSWLEADVVVQLDGQRPLLRLHSAGDVADHPLVVDQTEGISIAKAQQIAEHLNHATP
jgi:hypothetical protein